MFKIFLIETLTNMHVGSGDMSYGIIDKRVQRDVTTKIPVINASSLKGALKKHFENILKEDERIIMDIFGGIRDDESISGACRFFNGNLLSMPVRSNKKPFYSATAPMIIRNFINHISKFGYKLEKNILDDLNKIKTTEPDDKKGVIINSSGKNSNVIIEDYRTASKNIKISPKIKNLLGQHLAIFADDTFKNIVEEIPVIARNKLENGISENLWYEEVIPKKSKFYFTVLWHDEDKVAPDKLKRFEEKPVQIGANATIGYGYCKIKEYCGTEKQVGGKNE